MKPLVSVIILSYKNYHYIYEAIDSVLIQDYPNNEIIISNDGSSDFDKSAIQKYFKKKKNNNIKNIVLNNNYKNLGTVKNINGAIKLSKGDYILMFAADDVMYNSKTISQFIESFNSLPKKEMVVTSQVGMFDVKLKRLIQLFVSNESINKIQNLQPKKLFAEMSTQCILPGVGVCYKKNIFKKYNIFDERYVLVEDYSSALKLSRLGVKYNYFDFLSFKHRDGGISHGNINGEIQVSKKYEEDIINIIKNEIIPFKNLLNKKHQNNVQITLRNLIWKYEYKYKFEKNPNRTQRNLFIKKNYKNVFKVALSEIIRETRDQLIGKKIKIFCFGIIIFLLKYILKNLELYLNFLGIILILSSFFFIIFNYLKKYSLKVFKFIKLIV